jgi:hypothetical protein
MLMKLASGVNFANVLCAVFTQVDPKSAKRQLQLNYLFVLMGSRGVKALSKHVGEIHPRCVSLFSNLGEDMFLLVFCNIRFFHF